MQAIASKDAVARVRKALDLFQNGEYLELLAIDHVVPLANTDSGEEIIRPSKHVSDDEVVSALQQLEKTGYPIQIDSANRRIRFTQYPMSRQVTPQL